MNRFSEEDKQRMLSYPILSLLATHGRRTDRRGTLYFSPFRDERTPSFSINIARNVWYDHGEGKGGNVFTLAQRLLGIPDSRRNEIWEYLSSLDPGIVPMTVQSSEIHHRTSGSPILIDRVSETLPQYMYNYAASRCIGRGILDRYCSAVTYRISGSARSLTVIGFPAGNDGWVLRRATDREDAPMRKRCTSCTPTYLGPDGLRTTEAISDEVMVFEGFFDFLSWLSDRHLTLPQRDVCVLNSVSTTRAALPFLLSHGRIVVMLDNDKAGREHTAVIMSAALEAGRGFEDASSRLEGCKDVNEYLVRKRSREQSIKAKP